MLQFGMRPPFSWEDFLERCQRLIPSRDYVLIKNLPAPGQYAGYSGEQDTVRRWIDFDTALRNELVKLRASSRHIDAAQYLHAQNYLSSSLAQLASSAQRNPALRDAEVSLDRRRWAFLEELSFGHYFDLDCLIVYAYKLKILWRWEEVRRADKEALLEEVLTLDLSGVTNE